MVTPRRSSTTGTLALPSLLLVSLPSDTSFHPCLQSLTTATILPLENSGIPDPHHKDHDHDHFASFDRAIENLQSSPTLDNLLRVHDLHSQRLFERDEDHHHRGPHKGHEGDDDEKKKRIFKFILGEILKYHGLPQALSATELANNKTVA